jgi:hypothetical protein
MSNQEIIEVSGEIVNSLYYFLVFFAGLYVGYLFGRKDENDDNNF